MIVEDDEERILEQWSICPKPPRKRGWLVFSRERIAESVGTASVSIAVVQALLAMLQALVFPFASIPGLNWIAGPMVQYAGRNFLGMALRSCFWKARLKQLGQDTLIDQGVDFWMPERISVGDDCFIGQGARLSAGGDLEGAHGSITIGSYTNLGPNSFLGGSDEIRVGDFVFVAAGARLYSATATAMSPVHLDRLMSMAHNAPSDRRHTSRSPVDVGDYAVIGSHSIVLPGVSLGIGVIVHPFTEVNRSFQAFANVAGPGRARQIGWRRPLRPRQQSS